MFINYLKLALRVLVRQRFRTVINLLGFAFGIACSVLIYLYTRTELSYNDFHENRRHIFRIYYTYLEASGERQYAPFLPYQMSEGIAQEIPGVEKSCGLRSTQAWIGIEENLFNEMVGFTDSSFFDIFTFQFLAGNRSDPFSGPMNVVLTRSVAEKIFGDSLVNFDEIIGKTVSFPQPFPNEYSVAAILEDPPATNSFRWTVLVPYDNSRYYPQCNNAFGNTSIYVMLQSETDVEDTEETLQQLKENFHGERIGQLIHFGYLSDSEDNFRYLMQPLDELYLHSSDIGGCYEQLSNMRIIYILGSIALLILLIACFNYVMLTIASTMNRMKDLGLMNAMGAQQGQILRHFIYECGLLTLVSLGLGLLLSKPLLPVFNQLVNTDLDFTLFQHWQNFLFLAILLIVVVLICSLYVGVFLLRNNQPLRILRKDMISMKRNYFARYFVVLQYLITIVLLICSGIIVKQLRYMLEKEVGFEEENIVVLNVDFPYQKVLTLKEQLLNYSHIRSVSMSDRNFISGSSSDDIKNHKGDLVQTRFLRIDHDYLQTFGLQLMDGRNFLPDEPIDSNTNVIVNETFVEQMDLEDPVGSVINLGDEENEVTIIGVVNDFHFDSMHDDIMPVMLIIFPFNSIWAMFVKIDAQDIAAALEQIELAWNEVVPEYTIDYGFLSEMLDEQYNTEERWSRTTLYAAVIAILLSCLGLLGITSLLVTRRVKEIGIRKANGATVTNIVALLNMDILKWVGLSFVIAIPLSWVIIQRWLQDFAYKTAISWWIFALAGIATLTVSLLVITGITWSAARQNPANTLKYE
jgi:putative ABC transport system permease protein